jgi:hypothetical protein
MTTPNRFLRIPSARNLFVLLALTLLLVNVCVVNAQNTNSTNSNNSNANTNANHNGNRNGNGNSNANDNSNANTNVNANTNQNSNANGNSNQGTSGADQVDPVKSGWFFALVTVLFGGMLGAFVYVIARAILFSKGTFSNPLGLPDGSLRAMLAFTLVAFLGFYIYAGVLIAPSNPNFKPPDFLTGIVATVIGFYFGSRSGEGTGAPTTGVIQGSVTDKTNAPAVGAVVELTQSNGKKLTQKADASGKYKFDKLAAGDYSLQASLTGQLPSDEKKVTLTTGATQTVDLALK